MKFARSALVALLCGAVLAAAGALSPMSADTLSVDPAKRKAALDAITDTAAKICGDVAISGERDTVTLNGEAQARLVGLVKKLADLGITGKADVESATYQGLLQQDLPDALRDVRTCKTHVLDKLVEKLLGDQLQAGSTRTAGRPLTGATIVGNGQGAPAAEIDSTGSIGNPSTGAEINVQGAPGQSVTGLSVTQSGPGTGLRIIQNGPGVGMRVTVGVGVSAPPGP